MDTLRIQNIRSLADTGTIDLRPITLLVGRNSSGKSTFLRILPLLKQSVRTRSRAPVLWYGEYVDFGSISEARTKSSDSQPIAFEIGFKDIEVRVTSIYEYRSQFRRVKNVTSRIELVENDGETILKKYEMQADADRIALELDGRGSVSSAVVNEIDITEIAKRVGIRIQSNEVAPLISYETDGGASARIPGRSRGEEVEKEILRLIRPHIGYRIADHNLIRLVRRIRYAPIDQFRENVLRNSSDLVTWNAFLNDLTNNKKLFSKIQALYFLSVIPEMASSVFRRMTQDALGLSYIGPSRATGERYYRFQELGVDQIDPQGKNLAMYLNSLPRGSLQSFSDWLCEAIGYNIKIERSAGHVQVLLQEANSPDHFNMADMGYGFSQILPILAQVWSSSQRPLPSRLRSAIVAMEQPELHLHPAYQGYLADLLASVVQPDSLDEDPGEKGGSSLPTSRQRRKVRMVIETHSETIVNRLGELISEGRLSSENVAIYLFDKDEATNTSKVRKTTFDSDGVLADWPIGFFSSDPL